LFTGSVVKLIVSPSDVSLKRKTYEVHKALLCSSSTFFESQLLLDKKSLYLKEEPRVIEIFIGWLYRGTIPKISEDFYLEYLAKEQVRRYISLYLTAEIWKTPGLQNTIMDTIRARMTCRYGWFPCVHIQTIYNHTSSGSPLRQYIVDSLLWKGSRWHNARWSGPNGEGERTRLIMEHLKHGNHDFIVEYCEALYKAKGRFSDPAEEVGCFYHIHEEGKTCSTA